MAQPAIAPLVAGKIDVDLIAAHWNDVLRLAASLRTGVVSASAMLERLGSYPRANGLALALREIGRVERTLFTLDWIESPEQRRRATPRSLMVYLLSHRIVCLDNGERPDAYESTFPHEREPSPEAARRDAG